MKLLWICNLVFPSVAEKLNIPVSFAGGWLIGASSELKKNENYNLYILSCSQYVKKAVKMDIDGIHYIVIPNENYYKNFNVIKDTLKPDLVHVFGTELPHSWDVLEVFEPSKVVFSIQGIVSECEKYYNAEIPYSIQNRKGLYELLTKDTILNQKKSFFKRGSEEIKLFEKARYVIGRTSWDKAVVQAINNKIRYFKCNETLRSPFYDGKWDIKEIEEFSIFISQGSYPIKGLHFAIEAVNILIDQFPKLKLYVSGENILKNAVPRKKWKMASYSKYIYDLIIKYKLEDHVIFTGNLEPEKMKERYLKSHVFLCPSAIENSPNSLGEAMILGVPCIAAWVGGIPSMITHQKEGFLYQYNSSKMLAYYIKNVFENDEISQSISHFARVRARNTHDSIKNNEDLIGIYNQIMGVKNNEN